MGQEVVNMPVGGSITRRLIGRAALLHVTAIFSISGMSFQPLPQILLGTSHIDIETLGEKGLPKLAYI